MFLKTGEVKKMMKAALKSAGLTVGLTNNRYLVSDAVTNNWIIGVDEPAASNKFKAAIMELVGMLPEQGECYDFTLRGKDVCAQLTAVYPDVYSGWMSAREKAVVTPVILNDITHEYALCQGEGGDYFLVNRPWLNAISPSELEVSEEMPGAPVCRWEGRLCRMYFKNEFMAYQVTSIPTPDRIGNTLLPALSSLDFFSRDWVREPESDEEPLSY